MSVFHHRSLQSRHVCAHMHSSRDNLAEDGPLASQTGIAQSGREARARYSHVLAGSDARHRNFPSIVRPQPHRSLSSLGVLTSFLL